MLKLLTNKINEIDLITVQVNSLPDGDFIRRLEEDVRVRDLILTASIREGNIKSGVSTISSKEVNTILKLGEHHKVVSYLNSLNDEGLRIVAQDPSIQSVIDGNGPLSHRYSIITSSVKNSPVKYNTTLKYPPVYITGNDTTDTETLLTVPQEQIDELLDPNEYVQDGIIEQIRTVVASPEYIRRRTLSVPLDSRPESPYKSR